MRTAAIVKEIGVDVCSSEGHGGGWRRLAKGGKTPEKRKAESGNSLSPPAFQRLPKASKIVVATRLRPVGRDFGAVARGLAKKGFLILPFIRLEKDGSGCIRGAEREPQMGTRLRCASARRADEQKLIIFSVRNGWTRSRPLARLPCDLRLRQILFADSQSAQMKLV